jgi:hypothetical protein
MYEEEDGEGIEMSRRNGREDPSVEGDKVGDETRRGGGE